MVRARAGQHRAHASRLALPRGRVGRALPARHRLAATAPRLSRCTAAQGDRRKLQTEMDRTLKKVTEGVLAFDGIWNKVHDTEHANQKEKFEADLKKEIKKLQRYRDQIKTWAASSDVKDKKALVDARKVIEREMERFKVCEKETKTKAFSKEGLGQQPRTDPRERARGDARDWLNRAVDELQVQQDSFEAEIELLSAQKKGKTKPARLTHLEDSVARHREHVAKLETVLRLLDNEAIQPEDLEAAGTRDLVDDYVERNQEAFDEFVSVDEMYDSLNLEALSAALLAGAQAKRGGRDSDDSDDDSDSKDSTDEPEADTPAASPQPGAREAAEAARPAAAPPSPAPRATPPPQPKPTPQPATQPPPAPQPQPAAAAAARAPPPAPQPAPASALPPPRVPPPLPQPAIAAVLRFVPPPVAKTLPQPQPGWSGSGDGSGGAAAAQQPGAAQPRAVPQPQAAPPTAAAVAAPGGVAGAGGTADKNAFMARLQRVGGPAPPAPLPQPQLQPLSAPLGFGGGGVKPAALPFADAAMAAARGPPPRSGGSASVSAGGATSADAFTDYDPQLTAARGPRLAAAWGGGSGDVVPASVSHACSTFLTSHPPPPRSRRLRTACCRCCPTRAPRSTRSPARGCWRLGSGPCRSPRTRLWCAAAEAARPCPCPRRFPPPFRL